MSFLLKKEMIKNLSKGVSLCALSLWMFLSPSFAQEDVSLNMNEEQENQSVPEKKYDFYDHLSEVKKYIDEDLSYKQVEADYLEAQKRLPVVPKVKPHFYIGELKTYRARYQDTVLDIARAFDMGFVEMISANRDINRWIPGEGTEVLVPSMHLLPDAPREGIVINLSDMRLYFFDQRGEPVKTYPVGIGRDGLATPLGTTTVVKKKEGPWWYPTERMRQEDPSLKRVVKAGPENPLGTHGIYLGWPTFAIHGTLEPWGIGRRVSSGCMRLYPEDIVKFYPQVEVGTKVTVVDQDYKMAWINGALFLEIHPSKRQALFIEDEEPIPYEAPEGLMQAIYKEIEGVKLVEGVDWKQVQQAIIQRPGYPVKIAKREMMLEILEGVDPDLKPEYIGVSTQQNKDDVSPSEEGSDAKTALDSKPTDQKDVKKIQEEMGAQLEQKSEGADTKKGVAKETAKPTAEITSQDIKPQEKSPKSAVDLSTSSEPESPKKTIVSEQESKGVASPLDKEKRSDKKEGDVSPQKQETPKEGEESSSLDESDVKAIPSKLLPETNMPGKNVEETIEKVLEDKDAALQRTPQTFEARIKTLPTLITE